MTHLFSVLQLFISSLAFVLLLFFSTNSYAGSSAYDVELFCQDINIILQKVNVINLNIANANNTRTREGGPYKRKILINYKDGYCEEIRDQASPILKYDPTHEDALKNTNTLKRHIIFKSTLVDDNKLFYINENRSPSNTKKNRYTFQKLKL